MERAFAPALKLIAYAVDALIAHARQAPDTGTPSPPIAAICALHEVVLITSRAGDLSREDCADVIRQAFEHRLLEILGELSAEGASELISHARKILASALRSVQN